MLFKAMGDKSKPAILFFHAMGVTGESSMPVAEFLKDRYYCIMPTSTVYCPGQRYESREDEIRQTEDFLRQQGVKELELLVASSLGADIGMAFLAKNSLPVHKVFFDGGEFSQRSSIQRKILAPMLYLGIKSFYTSKGKTIGKIFWCDDENIRPYFIEAGKNLRAGNMIRQLGDSVTDAPYPVFDREMQENIFWEFGSIEEHFQFRDKLIRTYEYGNFPVFEGYDHMQFQIKNPEGFAQMLISIIEKGKMPSLPFLK